MRLTRGALHRFDVRSTSERDPRAMREQMGMHVWVAWGSEMSMVAAALEGSGGSYHRLPENGDPHTSMVVAPMEC